MANTYFFIEFEQKISFPLLPFYILPIFISVEFVLGIYISNKPSSEDFLQKRRLEVPYPIHNVLCCQFQPSNHLKSLIIVFPLSKITETRLNVHTSQTNTQFTMVSTRINKVNTYFNCKILVIRTKLYNADSWCVSLLLLFCLDGGLWDLEPPALNGQELAVCFLFVNNLELIQ